MSAEMKNKYIECVSGLRIMTFVEQKVQDATRKSDVKKNSHLKPFSIRKCTFQSVWVCMSGWGRWNNATHSHLLTILWQSAPLFCLPWRSHADFKGLLLCHLVLFHLITIHFQNHSTAQKKEWHSNQQWTKMKVKSSRIHHRQVNIMTLFHILVLKESLMLAEKS